MWLSILKKILKAYYLSEVVAKYRVHTGITKNKFSVLHYQWQLFRAIVGLNFIRPLITFTVYAYKGYIKSTQ